jgi:hypothetical protein
LVAPTNGEVLSSGSRYDGTSVPSTHTAYSTIVYVGQN